MHSIMTVSVRRVSVVGLLQVVNSLIVVPQSTIICHIVAALCRSAKHNGRGRRLQTFMERSKSHDGMFDHRASVATLKQDTNPFTSIVITEYSRRQLVF